VVNILKRRLSSKIRQAGGNVLKRIGVVTSGGDAPGMNAAIRAVVRLAQGRNLEVLGFERGWEGLITNTFRPLGPRSVSGIINLGGTILHTARCPEFKQRESVSKAAENLDRNDVSGLVVIGGNGSLNGALALSGESDAAIIGVPATIDNDVFGTDETVGFDTAVNTAVSEIDKIRDTAMSHERIFIVEVMGKDRGFLALTVGLTVGSEIILVPEVKVEVQDVIKNIEDSRRRGKKSGIIVAAEGVGENRILAAQIEEHTKSEVRLSVLGYAQRGGSPTARSRYLACLLGDKAVELILNGERNKVVGLVGCKIDAIDLEKSVKSTKQLDSNLLRLAKELAV
jgi:6-phosphofructokinase 1